jgi:hypothetical protein
MELEVKKLLLDVLTSCEAIQEFTAGKSFSEYEQSRLLRSATEREFEVIGEALGQIAPMQSRRVRKNNFVGFYHRLSQSHHSWLRFCRQCDCMEHHSAPCSNFI